jgi:hypothetical protein
MNYALAIASAVMTSMIAFVVSTTAEPKKPVSKPDEPRVYLDFPKCPAYPQPPAQPVQEYSDDNNIAPYKHCVCGYGVYAEHNDKVGRHCTFCGRAEDISND